MRKSPIRPAAGFAMVAALALLLPAGARGAEPPNVLLERDPFELSASNVPDPAIDLAIAAARICSGPSCP